jgi:uncharacterized Ntn-hydrolase superfamily protein
MSMRAFRRATLLLLAAYCVTASALLAQTSGPPLDPKLPDANDMGTYSLIVRDPETGEMGLGVQSKAFGAGNRVVTARGGFAVIAHQAVSNPIFGAVGMTLMESGMTPQEAMDFMVKGDNGANRRQIAILDFQGRSAAWTGPGASDWKGHKCTPLFCLEGNTLAGPQVLDAMEKSISSSKGQLAYRLLDALDAAQAAGGDWRGMQGAYILVVKPNAGPSGYNDRAVDLRVDDSREPLKELRRLVNIDRSNKLVAEANVILSNGRPDMALELVKQATTTAPDNDSVWVALATVQVMMGAKADAVVSLKKAAELNPANKVNLPKNPQFQELHKEMKITY